MYDSNDPSTWSEYQNPDDATASPGFFSGITTELGRALTLFGTQAASAYAENLRDRIRGTPTPVSTFQAPPQQQGAQAGPAGGYFQGGGAGAISPAVILYGLLGLGGLLVVAKLLK